MATQHGGVAHRSRILVVDDHPLVREGLRIRLDAQPDLEVCGEAEDVDTALRLLEDLAPDLMIVDLRLRSGSGLTLIRSAPRYSPATRSLVLTAQDEALVGERALRAGAHGFISKQEAQSRILDAIRTVLRGGRFISQDLTTRLVGRALEGERADDGIACLSNRETEVFQLIGQGLSTREVAGQLHLSVHTIESHREHIRNKLGLRNGAELVQHAVRWVLEQ